MDELAAEEHVGGNPDAAAGRRAAAIGAVAMLDDRVRRRLYVFIRTARHPVTREEAAAGLGISRKLAAFHLDKMVAAGLLEAGLDEARPRRVGRAPKAYQPVADAVTVSLPQRSYRLLAAILLDAAATEGANESSAAARNRAARAAGRAAGTSASTSTATARSDPLSRVETVLDGQGFEPFHAESGCLRLRNCPFHPMAAEQPDLVCGINHAYVSGLLDGLSAAELEAVLAPAPGECCVEIGRRTRSAAGP